MFYYLGMVFLTFLRVFVKIVVFRWPRIQISEVYYTQIGFIAKVLFHYMGIVFLTFSVFLRMMMTMEIMMMTAPPCFSSL